MRYSRLTIVGLTALLVAAAACSRPGAPGNGSGLLGPWGSDKASLAVTDTGAVLQILASGSCFGSYGEVSRPIATPAFDLPGTYTQLTGAYPGKVVYAAQYSGSVSGDQITLSIAVPALQQTFGPYDLTRGVSSSWTACLYP
jgi:hypothetical protein